MTKVNVACGPMIFAGWVNLDRVDMSSYVQFLQTTGTDGLPEAQATLARRVQAAGQVDFRVCDFRKGLPFPDNSVDFLYAGQVIEHLNPIHETPQFLAEFRRVLKPGGTVRISTPDLDLLLEAFLKGNMMAFASEQPEVFAKAKSDATRLSFIMFGSLGPASTMENYEGHMMCYSKESMREVLEAAGFVNVAFFAPGASQSIIINEFMDTGITHSLYAEAVKGGSS